MKKSFYLKFILFLFLIISFVLRLYLAANFYHGDLNNNISWGKIAFESGLKNFYEIKYFPYSKPNQPPLNILVLLMSFSMGDFLGELIWNLNTRLSFFPSSLVWFWEKNGMTLSFKIPSIFADYLIFYLLYRFFEKKKRKKMGIFLGILWIFNPVVWYNSSVWGQTDAIVNLFGLASVIFILKNKIKKGLIFYFLSLLFKASLIIFLPFFVLYFLKKKISIKKISISIFISFALFLFVSFLFHQDIDILPWIFKLYKDRIMPGEIGYLTANAFNFWWLVNPGKVLDSSFYFFLPARIWGYLIFLFFLAIFSFWLLKTKNFDEKSVFKFLILIAFSSFLFLTRIHERYLYPIFPLFTFYLGYDFSLVFLYFLLSLSHFLNLYHLYWQPHWDVLINLLSWEKVLIFISLFNIFSFFFLVVRFLKLSK